MIDNNTIFGRDQKTAKPKHFAPKKSIPGPRKKRSDAKHDIKFRLSPSDKKFLKLRAMDHNLSLTAFTSFIIKSELIRDNVYDNYEYENDGQFVHVMLDKNCFEMLKTLSVDWNLSFRRAAHQIIKDYIFKASGGVKIIHYND